MRFEGIFINDRNEKINWRFDAPSEQFLCEYLKKLGWKIFELGKYDSRLIYPTASSPRSQMHDNLSAKQKQSVEEKQPAQEFICWECGLMKGVNANRLCSICESKRIAKEARKKLRKKINDTVPIDYSFGKIVGGTEKEADLDSERLRLKHKRRIDNSGAA